MMRVRLDELTPELTALLIELLGENDDQKSAGDAARLAAEIMKLTEQSGVSLLSVGAALWRAVAGFHARLTLDCNEGAGIAGDSVMVAASEAAILAAALVEQRRRPRPEGDRPFPEVRA